MVVVVHGRGVLFPGDDLIALSQLAKNTATTMDHMQLIVDRRERERRLAEKRIREIETRVGLMLDSIKDYAMVVLDADGRIATWQPGAQHLFGYSRDQMDGRGAADLFDMTVDTFRGWLDEARKRGFAEREGTCHRRDGSTFIGATVIRPLVDEPGEPLAFAAVTHDVTTQRDLEARMRQGQKMEAIGQLAGGIAHDFNNLLTAILGYADWLERDLAGDPRGTQVREIQKAAERAADLTNHLLTFSRRQARRLAALDMSDLVIDLLPILRRLISDRIEIVDATSDSPTLIHADRTQIEQIVMNLVLNARDAMPEGGRLTIRTGQVWIGSLPGSPGNTPAGTHVVLEVMDTGVGMDNETRRRAFEPFFTTKGVGRGTGLGLATVYGIVQEMQGTVEIASELGKGTSLRVSLPAIDPAARALADGATGGRQETLLLVEQDASVRRYLKNMLESHGYRVIAAEHPRAALAVAQSFGGVIDLVISDVVMPGSSGSELVQLLGQKRPGPAALYISDHDHASAHGPASADATVEASQTAGPSSALLTRVRRILSAA
jgi:PAS domain S-box-containing protein